ncbi:MAG: TetR/AcrR family transcriptional regulator [Acidimicrobiales bacterium]
MTVSNTGHLDRARELSAGAPRPLLSRTAENRLGQRHHEILEHIESLFMERGFADITIGEIAARVGCSRRTLYEIAPSKEQLVLVVLDRFLNKKGRSALLAIDHDDPVITQLRSYLTGGLEFQLKATLSEDLADDAPARRLVDRHYRFAMTVVERLVRLGVDRGEFRQVDAAVVAATVAGASLYLGQPEIVADIGLPVGELVDQMLDFVLASLLHRTEP